MKSLKSGLIILGSIGLLFLGACGNNKPAADSGNSSPVASSSENTAKTETTAKVASSDKAVSPQKGGQVVESGKYHLEFVPEKEANGTHLDFYLQKGDNHEAIPDAKVTAQIQLPDGTQKTLPLTYDASGKHYAALLSEKASGQYQVKMIAEINGEKVDGRFNFNQ
ncbi:MAG: hypothetical protein ABI417_18450 [Coleofasciculaceae cyanobacterium]